MHEKMSDKNIKIASTPPGSFYCSEESYNRAVEKVFVKTWHLAGHSSDFKENQYLYPHWLLHGCLNEPLLITKSKTGEMNCVSNVCTHRGFILVEEPMQAGMIRCRYHGRCFSADGKFISMPEFEEAQNFPTRMDDLSAVPFSEWNGFYFAAISPVVTLEEILKPVAERLDWFPFHTLRYHPESSAEYHIKANWALYCDNYLEGFHIPYVHKSLNKVIDYGNYETHLHEYCNLQLGIAKDGEMVFDLPAHSPDHGKQVAAYYYWVFPNMMLNFYPWGLSVNIVQPKGVDRTTVSFKTYISDESKFNQGAGSDLNRVELEDEEVVESVQQGLRSRFYFRGRYSPKMEKGVHHFHMLMQQFLHNNSHE
ncbi:MAG: aromatic ring-hydroxylating dioxygenase subunit alpha [Chitinophagales bacterium]|nr:aromatic ring-hydroxylating dioxygenase subunit alpha [Chitinophagales bacterium]